MDPAAPEWTRTLRKEEGGARFRVTVPRPTQKTPRDESLNVMIPAKHRLAIVREVDSRASEFRTYKL